MTLWGSILLFLHLIGFALLLGAAVAQLVNGKVRVNPAMVWGAAVQLLTGLALAAPGAFSNPNREPDPAFLVVKGVVALLIFVMVFFSRRREVVAKGHFFAIVGLTVANAAVAVFW